MVILCKYQKMLYIKLSCLYYFIHKYVTFLARNGCIVGKGVKKKATGWFVISSKIPNFNNQDKKRRRKKIKQMRGRGLYCFEG